MRTRAADWICLLLLAAGCGDGVGRPLTREGLVSAGSGGTSGTSGTSGAAGATGGSATTSGGAASGGSAGVSDSAAEGGMAGNDERRPPFDTGFGGRAGRDWDLDRGGSGPAVPAGDYCAPVSDWDAEAQAAEQQLVQVLNFARESGVACARNERLDAPQLEMSPELRCAARLHSLDMSERAFFDHTNPDGLDAPERIRRAGYVFGVASESIARDDGSAGFREPYQALAQLFEDGGSDCESLVDARFDRVGIGFYEGLWTLDFAGP